MSAAPIQIVDEHDQPIGEATKQEAWQRGLIHRVVRIVVQNDKGYFLLQHRTPTKDIFPNCWDSAAAGHVDAGEDYSTAAQREIQEELGLKNLALRHVGDYRSHTVWREHHFNRFTRVYAARWNETPTHLEEGKIDGFTWMPLAEVKSLVREHSERVTDGLKEIIEKFY